MKGIRRTFLWTATALLLIVSMALPWTTFAYVTTDKPDYAPGEVVTISGDNRDDAGYLPGETVHVDVWGPNGYYAFCDATTGDDGAWWCQVTLWPNALAVGEYTYTATGQTSGVSQSGTFTDAIGLKILGSDDNQHQNSASSENLGSVAQGTNLALTCPRGTGISVQGTGLGSDGSIAWSLAYVTTYGQSTTLQPLTTLNPSSGTQTASSDKQCVGVTILTSSLVVGTTYYGQLRASQTGGTVTADYFFQFTVTAAANTTPTVTAPADQTAYEGTSKAFSLGSFSDPDGSPWAVDVDWGDGSAHTQFNMATAGTITAQPHTYDDNGEYTVTVQVTDSTNLSGSKTFKITVNNVAPTATLAATSPIDEGSSSTVSFTNPSDPCTADTTAGFHYAFSCTNGDLSGATYASSGTSASTSCTFADNGTFTVKGRIIDKDGGYTEYTASVTVNNVAPTATFAASSPINEGSSSTVSFTNPSDPSTADTTAGFHYAFSCTNGDLSGATYASSGTSASTSCTFADNGTFTVKGRIIDKDDGYTEYTASVTVNNVAPTVTITGPASGAVYAVGTTVPFAGSFTDPGTADTHTATWTFSSYSATINESGNVTQGSGNGTVSNNYAFTIAGVYSVQLEVCDDDNGCGTANTVNGDPSYVVIYDPDAGFVTGGGWIWSPAGAYAADEELEGKANFGFVSKYQRGAQVPTGQTEFQFKAGSLNFHSTSYEWLVVAGARAQYKGVGTINGSGSYGFMLTAIDGQINGGGGVDKFRIKIWEIGGGIVYDNQMGAGDNADPTTVIGGGSIVIHTGKK